MGDRDTVLIRVLEESPDSSVFVVQIQCRDPVLLAFWLQKSFFHNGQVQHTDTLVRRDGAGLEFVLRVLHRSERLSNAHYWSPFVVTLCLDALLFHYHLPTQIHRPGSIQQAMKENTLTLTRSQSAERRSAERVEREEAEREEVEGREKREEVEEKEKREEGKERVDREEAEGEEVEGREKREEVEDRVEREEVEEEEKREEGKERVEGEEGKERVEGL